MRRFEAYREPQSSVLDEWLANEVPELCQIDSDYAFLTERLGSAKKLSEEVTNTSKNYAVTRAYGGESGSIGGNLPCLAVAGW